MAVNLDPQSEQLEPTPFFTPEADALQLKLKRITQVCAEATPAVEQFISEFWDLETKLVFLGLSLKPPYFFQQEETFTCPVDLQQDVYGASYIKLTSDGCEGLLQRVLGPSSTSFGSEHGTPFEQFLMNRFMKALFSTFLKHIIKKRFSAKRHAPAIYLMWAFQPKPKPRQKHPDPIGRLLLTLPMNSLRLFGHADTALAESLVISDDFWMEQSYTTHVRIGSTPISLNDLRQLETGDTVVLESSNVKRLQLVDLQGSPSEVMFDIQIADPESITQDWTEEDALMMNPPGMPTASQSSPRPGGATGGENKANLWDNLIIDLKAEFEPVKMPLNQLKQISEGLIVEVGDLIHNRIRLHVDNKTLAHGELLIIGDKFAVKITDIEAERKPPGQSPAMTGGGPADMGMAAGLPGMPGGMMPGMSDMDQQPDGGSDEMADLDDFLNTDFDAQDENNGEGW